METKICSKCKVERTISMFQKTKKIYIQNVCKICQNARYKDRYKRNKDMKKHYVLPVLPASGTFTRNILQLLIDGKWHTTTELQEVGGTKPTSQIYGLRKRGWNIVNKQDNESPNGFLYKLVLEGEPAPPKRIYVFERFIDLMSDCNWHPASELINKFKTSVAVQNHLSRMRKQGFKIEKEYNYDEGCYCHRVIMD